MAEYFFELLTEEIPAWMLQTHFIAPVQTALTSLTEELGGGAVKVDATSRRLIVFLRDLPTREADRELEVKGPPKKSAYDASGNPTPALHGFLKKQGASADDVIDSADEYVRIRKRVAGREIRDILAERIPATIAGIRWPKMMRWGTGEHAYIRPIHSLVSVFDGEHLPIQIFDVASGTTTVGHRTLAPQPIETKSFADYVRQLELARVVVESERRGALMAQRAILLAREVDGVPTEDPSIVVQWKFLTEFPGLVRAEFRSDYLALPEEVLVTVMRVHQKQLPIRTSDGRLTNSFLAVLDNDGDPDGNAAYGNSFVTNARFADAQFFYETDRRRKLEERVEQLSHLQFQEKLGNYLDKTKRIERIAAAICSETGIDGADVATAARLCKTDLVTEMVKEFTDLQGRVGGIYAREEGQPDAVWQAIYDHYQPVGLDDALPRNTAGAIVSLADRIDTLAGFFSIGAKPTGSKDPFGLRRAAQGVVQILLNRDKREIRIGIEKLIDLGIEAHGIPIRIPLTTGAPPTLKQELLNFFFERVRTILEASAWGFAYDEVAAGMHAQTMWWHSLTDLVDRIQALKSMRHEPDFLSLLDSAKRIANITGDDDYNIVDPAKLEHRTEQSLNELTDSVIRRMHEQTNARDYRQALQSFAEMAPVLEQFFRDVMVNVDDPALRINRMALLRKAGGAARRIADVTKIVVDRRDYRA